MYKIEITYSWGDYEDPNQYGIFLVKEDAYKEICHLAGLEAFVYNEDFEEERTCEIFYDAFNFAVDLHYVHDNTWCHYRVIEINDK